MTAALVTLQKNSNGFTLVEMLMAMLVMTVGLLGLLQSVQLAYRQSLLDRVRDEAVLLAEEKMHDWRRESYQNISSSLKSEIVERTIGGGKRSFEVLKQGEEMGSGAGRSKRLKLAVTWSMRGDTQRHEIYTLKTR